MKLVLEQQLEDSGAGIGASAFRKIVSEIFLRLYPGWTDEDLMVNPRESRLFCHVVRRAVGCRKLPDPVVLKTLINIRKNGCRRKEKRPAISISLSS